MKIKVLLLSLLSTLGAISVGGPARSQVTSNQPSTFVNSTPFGHVVVDVAGQQQNIFHSFSELNTSDGRPLSFIANPMTVNNVISRVTGSATVIDGLITVTTDGTTIAPGVNLFLLSPNGITFGPNTITNIDGAFVASTASGIAFEDGSLFAAQPAAGAPLLTVSTPVGLQMGENPAAIQVQGINTTSPLGGLNSLFRGQNTVLIGGDINFDGGNVLLSGGRLQLAGLSEPGTVSLKALSFQNEGDPPSAFLNATLPADTERADISLFNNVQIIANGPVESIKISARDLTATSAPDTLPDNSTAILSGLLAGAALPYTVGDINIDTTGDIDLTQANIYSGSDFGSVGSIGNLNIDARSLYLTAGAQIGAIGRGTGNVGNLNINVRESVVLDGQNSLSDRLTGLYSLVGDLFTKGGSGQAGDVNLSTRSLVATDGALISASTLGEGNAGSTNIVADSILLKGANNATGIATSITSSVEFSAQGDGGNIDITASDLTIDQGAAISGRTQGKGSAGSISLTLDTLTIENGAQVVTTSFTDGEAGDVIITARDRIHLSGADPTYSERVAITPFNALGGEFSGIYANTTSTSTGAGGNITLHTGDLSLNDTAQISVSAQGTGAAGSLDINAAQAVKLLQGTIQAESREGSEGNIDINAPILLLRDRSQVTTNATGTATGGNILLNTPLIVGQQDSDILARATQGAGGNIDINASGLFGIAPRPVLTNSSDINASSDLGIDGRIAIEAPDVDPDNGIVDLPENLADASNELTAGCSAEQNQFIASGRGGLSINPERLVEGGRPWQDMRAIAIQPNQSVQAPKRVSSEPESTDSLTGEPIVEAASWRLGDNNKVMLMAAARPDLQQPTCLKPDSIGPTAQSSSIISASHTPF